MKILLTIIIFISLLFGAWQNVYAVDLLIDDLGGYPEVGGRTLGETSGFPEVIRYIYLFALGAAGIVALLTILIGAIMYIFSAGNPSKAADAKNRILSALLGILILLASVLILRTINPDLVNIGFTLPEIKTEAIFKGCFASQCLNECKPLCIVPGDAYCATPLDTGTCPEGQSACYCAK